VSDKSGFLQFNEDIKIYFFALNEKFQKFWKRAKPEPKFIINEEIMSRTNKIMCFVIISKRIVNM